MYNGIGLTTPRGSGTNGFVQRNLSFVRKHKDRVDYKSEEEIRKLDQSLLKQPNQDILEHERKRKVELKCMEMHELMEEQGYSAEEIEGKVSVFRKMLMEKEGVSEVAVDKDEFGRPVAKETHQLAEANHEKNAKLRDAFGLGDYVEGSAFDPARKAKEEAAKALAMAQKKYSTVESSDSEERSPSPPPKKKKKKSREASSSPERREKKKKSKKHKHDRSESKKNKKTKKRRKRVEEKKKRRKRKESSSSDSDSDTDSESDSGSSSSAPSPDRNGKVRKSSHHSPSPAVVDRGCPPEQRLSPTSRSKRSDSESELDKSPLRSVKQNGHGSSKSAESKTGNGKISPSPKRNRSKSLSYSPADRRWGKSSPYKTKSGKELSRGRSPKHGEKKRQSSRGDSRSASRSPSKPKKRSPGKRSRRSSRSPTHSRSRSRSYSRSRSRSRKRDRSYSRSRSHSRRRSYSRSPSHDSRRRESRSPSIRRRKGSPSHLDKRRITSARKRPVPYYRPSPPSPSSDDSYRSYSRSRSRSRFRSRSLSLTKRYTRRRRRRSWSSSSLDSLKH
ncbi:serine/arginine repetitive matrix protein 2-like isoform X2 [Haliotis asinina]|uniref:serine/arginine repetitive matrix protein 2-like isoform X2 n=1 Tax=Haliotis asinina TaxID=109174 RepID=UPI003531D92C